MSKKNYSDERMPYPMFGLEMGDGWKPIAQKVVDKILEYNNNSPEDSTIYIDQVKEKFAGLRIYVTYDNVPEDVVKEIEQMIKDAEMEASKTCEECGTKENVGMRVNGWYTVMCEDCAKKIIEKNPYYGKLGIKWKRFSDDKIFEITKDGIKEV